LAGFAVQGVYPRTIRKAPIGKEFKPELRFVGFFFYDAQFGEEFASRPCPARRSIVGTHRRSRAEELMSENIRSPSPR